MLFLLLFSLLNRVVPHILQHSEQNREPNILSGFLAMDFMYKFHLGSYVSLRPKNLSSHGVSLRGYSFIKMHGTSGSDQLGWNVTSLIFELNVTSQFYPIGQYLIQQSVPFLGNRHAFLPFAFCGQMRAQYNHWTVWSSCAKTRSCGVLNKILNDFY